HFFVPLRCLLPGLFSATVFSFALFGILRGGLLLVFAGRQDSAALFSLYPFTLPRTASPAGILFSRGDLTA
ncbi:hypothetical protein, partial [Jonquetella anthropi]|uniref:hypothetical protein n=1 Tax=Jonquetella anthropi TaxID=428712 RepID=UPI0023F57A41